MNHLTPEQISRYVSRSAGVDEILAIAQHLDSCFDCRDKAAALVDDGSTSRRKLAKSGQGLELGEGDDDGVTPARMILTIVIAVLIIVLLAVTWWMSH